jgi:hypothetical protein
MPFLLNFAVLKGVLLNAVMLNAIMLNVVKRNFAIFNGNMLNVVMLNVVTLSGVAPKICHFSALTNLSQISNIFYNSTPIYKLGKILTCFEKEKEFKETYKTL